MLCPQGAPRISWGALVPVATPWAGRRGPALGNKQLAKTLDSHDGTSHTQEFSGGTDSCSWGLEGAGRGRGKYIFKDNLEANIIFILIYPQSSLARPQTCLMSKNCKMATNPTCLPLHRLWAVRGTQIFQQCDCCRRNGCKEHQGRQQVPNSQRRWATKLPIQENEVLPSTPASAEHGASTPLHVSSRDTQTHMYARTYVHTPHTWWGSQGLSHRPAGPSPFKFLYPLQSRCIGTGCCPAKVLSWIRTLTCPAHSGQGQSSPISEGAR